MRQFLLGKAPLGQGEAGAIVHQADFAAPPYYLIRDDFTNDVAAGTVPGTDAVPGPGRRDGYDTGSKLAIAGTVMAIVNSVGSQDPTLIYNAMTRQAGRIFLTTITTISTGNHGRIGWSVNDADGTVLDSGLRFVNASSLATQVAGAAGPEVGSFAAYTFYEVAIILRAAGFAAYVRGGIYANFELVWLSESVVTSPMFAGAQVIGAGRGFYSHYMHVPAQLWLSAPLLSDGFSSLGESDGLGHAEGVASSIAGQGGNGVTYTQHGTWAVAANALGATALSGGYAIYHAAQPSADVMATVKISTFAGGNAGLLLRYTDSNNHITCHHNGTNLILAKRVAGVGTTIFSPAVTFVAGAELRVNMRGDKFRVYYNGALISTEQTIADAILQSATNAGIYTTDAGNRFKDLTIYARGTDGSYDSVLGALSPMASLTGATWAVDANGRGYNTPTTTGSELLTNGGFEGTYSAGLAPSWTKVGAPTVAESGDAYAGTAAQSIANTNTSLNSVRQNISAVVGSWYRYEARLKRTAGTGSGRINLGSASAQTYVPGTSSYALAVMTFRVTTTSEFLQLYADNAAATILWDSASAVALSLPTLLAYTQGTATDTPLARLNAIATGTQAGAIGWCDDPSNPQNFVIAIRNDSGSVNLTKCVGGTYTNLISSSVSFVADAAIEVRRPSGNTFQLWYNGSQVGADQTISDAAIANNAAPYYGPFSTYAGNTFTLFTLNGVVYRFPGA